MSELALHVSVAQFLRVALPSDAFFTTIGHGGFRIPIQVAKRLKAMGLKAGVPDLLVIYGGRPIFIELKQPGKKPTPVQREAMFNIEHAGGFSFVCRSVSEVEGTLRAFMPIRAHA